MKKIVSFLLLAFGAFLIYSFFLQKNDYKDEIVAFKLEDFATGLEHPWSMAFLPDGRILVSERVGRLRTISKKGKVSPPITGLPAIHDYGQGGALGVAIDPDFKSNNVIYFSFSESIEGNSGTAVAKAKLEDNALKDLQIIFRQEPKTSSNNHFGSRLVFANDGNLFITLGEKFSHSKESQNISNHLGKLVRINSDGTIPKDNPFVNKQNAKPQIWSFGHRNMQGAALHPTTGKLWTHEHGPKGGDEINIPIAGKNYGWPNASYGSHYSMIPIKDDHLGQGYEEPIHYWTPSIAPSGMMFYTGDIFPKWKGSLFVGSLAQTHLARLELDGNKVINEYRMVRNLDYRVRDVAQDKEGYIYFLVDSSEGKIVRILPK